jgi:hypothetical protein
MAGGIAMSAGFGAAAFAALDLAGEADCIANPSPGRPIATARTPALTHEMVRSADMIILSRCVADGPSRSANSGGSDLTKA